MSIFDKIYEDTLAYRNKFQAISTYLQALTIEKQKQTQLVTYYRRRCFLVNNAIDPIIDYLEKNSVDNEDVKKARESRIELLKARSANRRRRLQDEYIEEKRRLEAQIKTIEEYKRELKQVIDAYDDSDVKTFNNIWLNLSKKYNLPGVTNALNGYKTINNLNEVVAKRESLIIKENNIEAELSELNDSYMRSRKIITEQLRAARKKVREEANVTDKRFSKSEIDPIIRIAKDVKSTLLDKDLNVKALSDQLLTINNKINDVNTRLDSLRVDIEPIPRLPEPINNTIVTSIYNNLKNEINQVKSLYPQKKFEDSLRVINMISHDISENRGYKAFNNRKSELVRYTNSNLRYFNTHTWQITGRRWERIQKPNVYGFRDVAATHSPIQLIS